MAALRKLPYLMTPPWTLRVRAEKSGLPDDGGDERVDDVGDEGVDDGGEGGADDDGDGEVDDVAAEDEVAKAFEHGDLRVCLVNCGKARRVYVRAEGGSQGKVS